jgi:hypothetical protein
VTRAFVRHGVKRLPRLLLQRYKSEDSFQGPA